MHIGILTACYRRPKITEFCLSYMRDLRVDGVSFTRLAVTSENDALPQGWHRVDERNLPLGNKWNSGMRAMREIDPDYVLIMGSDDICNAALIEYYRAKRPEFGSVGTLYVYDSQSRKTIYLYRGRMGAGRIVDGRLLERCNWRPWNPEKNKGLDRDVERSVGMLPEIVKSNTAAVMDIKSQQNIWAFQHLERNTRSEAVNSSLALGHFGLTLDDMAHL